MIRLENLTKKFGEVVAVNNLSFEILRGEVFGLLGKNGAGKTTTIKMLTLQLNPTSGQIFFEDKLPQGNEIAIKNLIGIVPQHLNFDQDLTVGENLELHARLYHLPKSLRQKKIDELLNFVELQKVKNSFIKNLSGGMKRRLLIIRALIHSPKILFKAQGITIILTTHYIEEAEFLCDRVAILNLGKLVALDTTKNLCGGKSLEEIFLKLTN